MNKKSCFFSGFAGALALLFAAGCETGPKYFKVMPSNLNYCEITYAGTNVVAIMEFRGTGYCSMRKSKEAGITNPFSQLAHDATELRLDLSPSEVKDIFQSMVYAGVYEEEPKNTKAEVLPYTHMSGRIENSGFARVSRTPKLLELATDMMALFEKPEEHRRMLLKP